MIQWTFRFGLEIRGLKATRQSNLCLFQGSRHQRVADYGQSLTDIRAFKYKQLPSSEVLFITGNVAGRYFTVAMWQGGALSRLSRSLSYLVSLLMRVIAKEIVPCMH